MKYNPTGTQPNKMVPSSKEEVVKSFICYQCMQACTYLFDDSRCKDCTRLTPEEIRGDE